MLRGRGVPKWAGHDGREGGGGPGGEGGSELVECQGGGRQRPAGARRRGDLSAAGGGGRSQALGARLAVAALAGAPILEPDLDLQEEEGCMYKVVVRAKRQYSFTLQIILFQ